MYNNNRNNNNNNKGTVNLKVLAIQYKKMKLETHSYLFYCFSCVKISHLNKVHTLTIALVLSSKALKFSVLINVNF